MLSVLGLVNRLSGFDDVDLDTIGEILGKYTHKYELLNMYRIIDRNLKCFFHIYVLNRVNGINLDDFVRSDIEEMLIDLQKHEVIYQDEILLSNIVSDDLIRTRLIPLLENDNEILSSN